MRLPCRPLFQSSLFAALALATVACTTSRPAEPPPPPIPGAKSVDHLIRPGEKHFAHLWQLTFDGENAEAYFSPDGTRLVFQRRGVDEGCDSIWVTPEPGNVTFDLPEHRRVSNGLGATTCSYFLPSGEEVVYASTHADSHDCPPKPDFSEGYVWAIHPTFDIYAQDLVGGAPRLLIGGEGYDAEATVSPRGDRMVFTSTRSGDLELWTSNLAGGDLRQVTDAIGYDGGAFFSHDGEWLVFRTTAWTPGEEESEQATYRELLGHWKIRPHSMELHVVRADGTERRQVTHLGGANWAPYFYPDDSRILFSTNHHVAEGAPMDFDLFAIDVDGSNLERITFEETFDSFPMFSPDGKYLVFASNRGGSRVGETNLFIARWQD